MKIAPRFHGPTFVRFGLTVALVGLLSSSVYAPSTGTAVPTLRESPKFAPEIGYLPSPIPLHVEIDAALVGGAEAAAFNTPITLADGTLSPPDTVFLRFHSATVEGLQASVESPGKYRMKVSSDARGANAIVVGGPGVTIETWMVVRSMDLCVTAETLIGVVHDYAGVFGGRLDEVLALIASTFAPIVGSPLGATGPCIDIKRLIPLAVVLLQHDVPLPANVPVRHVVADVYGLKITGARDQSMAKISGVRVAVSQW